MCGIASYIGFNNRVLIEQMCSEMVHRGPNDFGYYFDDKIGMGLRRLSIIDLSGGHQPMHNEDQTVWIVCNGEIYNYKDITEELIKKGHRFSTKSDTEAIIHAYEEYGMDFLSRLDGMFAFVLFDKNKRKVLIVRDRLGIKPLYYMEIKKGLVVASEIKAIKKCGLKSTWELDEKSLDLLLSFRHIPSRETLIKDIKKALPGHYLEYDLDSYRMKETRYWRLPSIDEEENKMNFHDAVEEVKRLLSAAVKSHMVSDVPIGAALSGGLDSSVIVSQMSQFTSKPVKTYAVSFGDERDELQYARLAANEYKTDHRELKISPGALTESIPFLLWHAEEPIVGSLFPTMLYAKAAKEDVKVLLVGEGSDEIFAGYDRFKPLNLARYLPWRLLKWGYIKGLNGFTPAEKRKLYSPSFNKIIDKDHKFMDAYLNGKGDTINEFLNLEIENALPFHQLLRVDKMTMAYSVEARVPFLDRKLVEFVCKIPSKFKIRGIKEKYILKKAMRNNVPSSILKRTKLGMCTPFKSWFMGEGTGIFRDEVNSKDSVICEYFQKKHLEKLLKMVGKYKYTSMPEGKLMAIYQFSIWHKMFIQDMNISRGTI